VDAKETLVRRIQHDSLQEGYWSDNKKAREEQSRLSAAEADLGTWKKLQGLTHDLQATAELLAEADDAALAQELEAGIADLEARLHSLDFTRMMSGPYDRMNALLNVHPGAGGTESQDWAQMLLRMYTRWAERRGWKVELLDLQPGDEAGIKNATIKVVGEWAFGHLRAEKGVHRLVRISPFDSNARRHTSFCSVEPFPEIDETIEVVINEKDIQVDTFRASGAGGQHVNRTDSAVRITHFPSGLVVTCQNERSQIKNRASAMSVLKARLFALAEEEQKAKNAQIAGEKKDINFGSQIRSYVLHPYQMVKDHRTDIDYSQAAGILEGDLDQLVEDYLRKESAEKARFDA
jgi:peptide chain release factor 2